MQLLLAIARRAACTVQAALHETPVMQARACSNKSCVHVSFLGKGDSPRPAAPPACLQGRVCACVALLQTGPELVKEALGGLEEDGWGERTAGCGAARGKRPGGASATTACTQVKQQCMAMRGRQLHAQQTSCCWQQPPPPPTPPPTTNHHPHPPHPPTHPPCKSPASSSRPAATACALAGAPTGRTASAAAPARAPAAASPT